MTTFAENMSNFSLSLTNMYQTSLASINPFPSIPLMVPETDMSIPILNDMDQFSELLPEISNPLYPEIPMEEDLEPSNLMEKIQKFEVPMVTDLKLYMKHQIKENPVSATELLSSATELLVSDLHLLEFLNREICNMKETSATLSDLNQIPKVEKELINQKLGSFCHLFDNEVVNDRKTILSLTRLLQYWPFLRTSLENKKNMFPVEIAVVSNQSIAIDIMSNLNCIIGTRYHVVIKTGERDHIVICYSPDIGYICQIFVNSIPRTLTQYNHEFQKTGGEFHYQVGDLKLFYQYDKGHLQGPTLWFLNRQIALILPYDQGQLHGLIQIVDPDQQAVYQEIRFRDHKLLSHICTKMS